MDQIRKYTPPPNPAKITDSRSNGYISRYGNESWELDALEPRVIEDLICKKVLSLRNDDLWEAAVEEETAQQGELKSVADN
jgi:hypothetical protein